VDSGAFPGAVLAVGRHGRLALAAPVGHYGVDDHRPVEAGTIYDLASLTKVVGLTTACMILVDEGELALAAAVPRFLPGVRAPGCSGRSGCPPPGSFRPRAGATRSRPPKTTRASATGCCAARCTTRTRAGWAACRDTPAYSRTPSTCRASRRCS